MLKLYFLSCYLYFHGKKLLFDTICGKRKAQSSIFREQMNWCYEITLTIVLTWTGSLKIKHKD